MNLKCGNSSTKHLIKNLNVKFTVNENSYVSKKITGKHYIKISLYKDGATFDTFQYMAQDFQQLDLQTLLDLLAEETEKFTKAFISGKQGDLAQHKIIIDVISEIKRRKQGHLLPANLKLESASDPFSDATPTTTE